MIERIVDTGPLVALLNRRDAHHRWARELLDAIEPPLFTCDAVLSEACFLVRHLPGAPDAVLELLARDIVRAEFQVAKEIDAVRTLMSRFASVPMSLADACLVRMSELSRDSEVITLDSNFQVYRRNRRQLIPTMRPRG